MNQKKEDVGLTAVPGTSGTSNISHIDYKMKKRSSPPSRFDLCQCVPLSIAHQEEHAAYVLQKEDVVEGELVVLASQALRTRLDILLQKLLPRIEALSLLVLHMSQRESTPLAPHSSLLYKRRRYHALPGLLEQVLANMQRVIRVEDEMVINENTGVAIIFPQVDQQGAQIILERVYSSICLLQAETLIPPLTRETTISLGVGTCVSPATSLETLYRQAGRAAQSLVLRPVITTQLRGVKPMPARESVRVPPPIKAKKDEIHSDVDLAGIPFMELPQVLPTRLTQLIPCALAMELRCAPVGRDQHCLTVAMLDPTNTIALRHLQRVTGMTIFPVACDESALNSLLAHAW
ncbi:MAG: hypothetical protein NVS2B12_29870 [Ktedonobacteraceae bacterium]